MVLNPLSSCSMPTCNRQQFVPQAMRYFLRQDYENRGLVIIDEGENAIGDFVGKDSRIICVRFDHPRSLGAKRNLSCELCHGDLIPRWDDDDRFALHRLSAQVSELLTNDIDVCGLPVIALNSEGQLDVCREARGSDPSDFMTVLLTDHIDLPRTGECWQRVQMQRSSPLRGWIVQGF